MKSLLSILTAVALVTVAFAGPGLAGDEKKTSGGTTSDTTTGTTSGTSGTSGATGQSPSSDDKGAASPKTGGDQGSAAPSSGAAPTAEKPASKDDCKDNAWQKFGFKDEVECVSSVEKKTQ
jgi:hypothetical protein